MVRRGGSPSRLFSVLPLLGSLPWLLSCSGGEAADAAPEPEEPKELVIFVYDRSWSIPDHTLEMAQQLTTRRLQALDHGDRIATLQVLQRSLAEPPKRWSQSVPEREYENATVRSDSVSRQRFLQDVGVYLHDYSTPEDREGIQGTDILSSLHDVAAELEPYRGRRATLYLFSDMLQSTPEIEMEGLRHMPSDDWVSRLKAEERLPDLTGLCVVVVGARVDTEAGQRVKDFWSEYFEATGATLFDSNYMLRPVELPTRPCGDRRDA